MAGLHTKSIGRSLAPDERGAVAVVFALALLPLLGSVGAAIDNSRAASASVSLQAAVDAAVVAAVSEKTPDQRDARARLLVKARAASLPHGAVLDEGKLKVEETLVGALRSPQLRVSASANLPTTIMTLLGQNRMSVAAAADARVSGRSVEIALVVDVTGSMKGTRIEALRTSARAFVNTLLADGVNTEQLRLSIVPYTASVNIGRDRGSWLEARRGEPGGSRYDNRYIWREVSQAQCQGTNVTWNAALGACHIGTLSVWDERGGPCPGVKERGVCYVSDGWAGCVEERGRDTDDMTDAPPSTRRFRPYYWPSWNGVAGSAPDNRYNSYLPNSVDESRATNGFSNDGRGPNVACPQNAITNWTNDRTFLLGQIDRFEAWHRGGTMGHIGLVWGWRMLSPRWRGFWGDPLLPRDYDTTATDKIVVFMTDGENGFYTGHAPPGNSDYTAYGRIAEIPNVTTANAQTFLDQKMLTTCTAMRALGIEVFTVGLALSAGVPGQQARTLLRGCATSPAHFFDSNTATLVEHFQRIATEISNRRIHIAR